MFFVDGFGLDTYHRMKARGELPNIERHLLSRGVEVRQGVASIPTITYANAVSLITGLVPSHHGIISNRWFDPTIPRGADYCTIATYQNVDHDYSAKTIHDLLAPEDSVSLMAAQRRGCDYTIDNVITAGVNWAFENQTGVDCLVAQNMEEIAEHSRERGRWPTFVMAYFPGVDHRAHDVGKTSPQYDAAVRNADQQIGRICDSLRQAGVYDSTYLVLVSDHGHACLEPGKVLDVPALLRKNSGRKVVTVDDLRRHPKLVASAEAVVAHSGSRWVSVHFRKDGDWKNRYFTPYGESPVVAPFVDGAGGSLARQPEVELAAGRHDASTIWLRTRRGVGLVSREMRGSARYYRYQPAPADALGYMDDPSLRDFVASGMHESREWLEKSVHSGYPDFVPQIVEMFDSPRAGDIVLFASAGSNFSYAEKAGAHGSILPDDMLVPMVLAGPGLPVGRTIPVARTVDVMPTVLDMLALGDRLDAPESLDGISLLPRAVAGVGEAVLP